ncbi:hypothetical protein BGW38_003801 [Lunasporangiospora selenospora]|uniref:Wax synthase domain-containing protein n=1 Tax=Lunasporangiospora selenospora TaxID=979761 RepID=A0A9P6G134_9FUNG|nr:hypothetical protein BGW38_003801 [Lunasporangiospora selenospora]
MLIFDPAWAKTLFPFFVPLTTPSPDRLFPTPHSLPTGIYVAIYFPVLIASYALLLSPFPKTTVAKQILAFPLLLFLLFYPILLTCPQDLLHLGLSVISSGCLTRLIDLYYVQPWTGIPSRYYVRILMAESMSDSVARAKKDLEDQDKKESVKVNGSGLSSSQGAIKALSLKPNLDQGEPLTWTSTRFRSEMLSPLRNYTSIQPSTRSPNAKQLQWQDLVATLLLCELIQQALLFMTSFYTPDDLDRFTMIEFWVFAVGVAVIMITNILSYYYIGAMAWSWHTGNTLDTSDWAVLGTRNPFLAVTPVDFWNNWHTLFRYIWVDLGFLPTQRLCKQYLRPDTVGSVLSKAARQALPVMSVFALSGLMHGYIVYTSMGQPFWGQFVYFMIQSVAVILTKVASQTPTGRWIEHMYTEGGTATRLGLRILGVLSMFTFHAVTFPLFMHPYATFGMWYGMRYRSLFWWYFGKK